MSESVPHTALVVALDLGEKNDIHPKNKAPVGERLALAARKIAYGERIVHSGPTFESASKQEGALLLSFKHLGGGLELRGHGGFEIAGTDGVFSSAQVEIVGDKLRVWSPDVPAPEAARYAWHAWPEVSLYNKDGLPASPFRSNKPL